MSTSRRARRAMSASVAVLVAAAPVAVVAFDPSRASGSPRARSRGDRLRAGRRAAGASAAQRPRYRIRRLRRADGDDVRANRNDASDAGRGESGFGGD
jgi:hypothetical protein